MDPLKALLSEKRTQIKNLKADLKTAKKLKEKQKQIMLDSAIVELEKFVHRFRPAAMQPKKINNIVINYKLYESYMKKLDGFAIQKEVTDEGLYVIYSNDSAKGMLFLDDLTHFFPAGSEFPEGKLQETSLV